MGETPTPLPFRAAPPFVGRKVQLAFYQQFLSEAQGPWMLLVSGQSGNGKTQFLKQLERETPNRYSIGRLDFHDELLQRRPLPAAAELGQCLRPLTDAASFQTFWQEYKEARDLISHLPASLQQVLHVETEAQARDIHFHIDTGSLTSEVRQQAQERMTFALIDLARAARGKQLVVLLDTCEWFQEPAGQEVGNWLLKDLLPRMHVEMGDGLRVVAASREPLHLPYSPEETHHLPLAFLPRQDLMDYLQQIGMQDVDLRQAVYEMTRGHPLCLGLVAQLWQEPKRRALGIADFPALRGEFTTLALTDWVVERILNRMGSPYRELIKFAVLLRSFDLPLLQQIFPELLGQGDEVFLHLIRNASIIFLANGRYTFHDLLRQVQANHLRRQMPDLWRTYHQRALDAWKAQPEEINGNLVMPPDYYYHLLALDARQGSEEWEQAFYQAALTDQRDYAARLLQAVDDSALLPEMNFQAKRAFHQGRFFHYTNQLESSITSYQQALALFQQTRDEVGQSHVLLGLGEIFHQRNDEEAALPSYQQALALARQAGHRLAEANALRGLGDVHQFQNKREAALQNYREALVLFQREGERIGEGLVLKAMGDVFEFLDQQVEALTAYQQALDIFQETGSRSGEANVLQALGKVKDASNREEAYDHYQQALTIYRDLGARPGEAAVLRLIGRHLFQRGEPDEAFEHYKEALALSRQVGSRLSESETLRDMGDVRAEGGERDEALTLYHQALDICTEIQYRRGEARALSSVGELLAYDDARGALKCYNDARLIFHQISDRLGEANARRAIGDIYRLRSLPEAALTSYRAALEIYQQIHHVRGLLYTHMHIGDILLIFRQELEPAQVHYEEALKIFRQMGDRNGEAHTYLGIGQALMLRQVLDESLSYCQQAFALFFEARDQQGAAKALLCMGIVRILQDDPQAALKHYQTALDLLDEDADRKDPDSAIRADLLLGIADSLRMLKNTEEATKYYQQAQQFFRETNKLPGQARVICGLGGLSIQEEDFHSALACYQEALTLFRMANNRLGQAQMKQAIGGVLFLQEQTEKAIASYEEASHLFEQLHDHPHYIGCLLGQALAFMQDNRYEHALDVLTQAVQHARERQNAILQTVTLVIRAGVYYEQDNLALAIQDMETALELGQRYHLRMLDEIRQMLAMLYSSSNESARNTTTQLVSKHRQQLVWSFFIISETQTA